MLRDTATGIEAETDRATWCLYEFVVMALVVAKCGSLNAAIPPGIGERNGSVVRNKDVKRI